MISGYRMGLIYVNFGTDKSNRCTRYNVRFSCYKFVFNSESLINTETEEPTDAMDFKGRAASSNCPSSGSASLLTGLRVIPTSDIFKEYPAVFSAHTNITRKQESGIQGKEHHEVIFVISGN